jgi:hypothetical protein
MKIEIFKNLTLINELHRYLVVAQLIMKSMPFRETEDLLPSSQEALTGT